MSWFSGKVSLGNLPDFSEAVNKFSESVKNIEKNFDNALGFEEKSNAASGEASGLWLSSTDRKLLADPAMAFIGHTNEESTERSSENPESSVPHSHYDEKNEVEPDSPAVPAIEQASLGEEVHEETIKLDVHPDPAGGTNITSAKETKIILLKLIQNRCLVNYLNPILSMSRNQIL